MSLHFCHVSATMMKRLFMPVEKQVSKHNCRIWGIQNPHYVLEYERESPKTNLWRGIKRNRVVGSFFFIEKTPMG